MEGILNFVIENELMEDNLNIDMIGRLGLELAEPLHILDDEEVGRAVIPRNQNYYEQTISHYMGDLFVEHFRMSRETVEEFMLVLADVREIPHTEIPFQKKVLFSIWVLAKPESFLAAGDRFGLARSTAHNIFKEIIHLIVAVRNQFITWPQNHAESIEAFQERSQGFPGVVGAIDGCHIQIKQPPNNAHDYYNRKEFHSIILQGICDHNMKFIDIFVGMPGRVHDARVFRLSSIYQALVNIENPLLPENLHLIGDSAYPIMTNILTPFRDNGHLNDMETNYNLKLSQIRSTIERAFGRLKGKFRRLKYLDIGNPDFGCQIIAAACILHNLILMHDNNDDVYENDEPFPNPDRNEEPMGNYGQQKRLTITQLLYN